MPEHDGEGQVTADADVCRSGRLGIGRGSMMNSLNGWYRSLVK